MKPETMSMNERSILLYLESRAVDAGGLCKAVHMNQDDFSDIEKLKAAGLVEFFRIPAALLGQGSDKAWTHWTRLSDAGFELAAACRKLRAVQQGPYSKKVQAELLEMGKLSA